MHFTCLVINGLGGGHTDTSTDTDTHILTCEQKQFQEIRSHGLQPRAPSLKRGIGIESEKVCKQVRDQKVWKQVKDEAY